MRSLLIHAAALAMTLAATPAPARAQEIHAPPMPAVELSVGYSFMRDFSDDRPEDMNFPMGWYAAAAANLNRWFGVVGEATGSYKRDVSINYGLTTFTQNARVHTFMAGPRFSSKQGRLVPYAQVLVGAALLRTRTMFQNSDDLVTTERVVITDTRFAVQPGGGLSFLVTENLGVRVGADYRSVIEFVGDEENDYTNQFRVLTGFTFNWGAR